MLAISEYRLEVYVDGGLAPVCLTQADTFWPALYFVLTVSCFFLAPLAVLVALYAAIARALVRGPKAAGPGGGGQKYRRQVVLMLGAVVIAFFVCLLPFKALTLVVVVLPEEIWENVSVEGYYILLYFCRIMLYLNSAVNPILYNTMSSKFRSGFLRLCGVHRKRRRGLRGTRCAGAGGEAITTGTRSSSTRTSSTRTSETWRASKELRRLERAESYV